MALRRRLALGAAALVLGAAGWLVLQRMIESLVFQPTPGLSLRPDEVGIDAEQLRLRAEDGTDLHAFYLPAPGGASRALLFLHGNAGNASHRLPNAALLARLGSHVLLLDYRGYGLSGGRPSERGVYADARAALEYLVSERGIPQQRVVVFGRSLGGAVAVDLAQHRPLAGVILEATFSSLRAAAQKLMGPFGALVGPRFDSLRKVPALRSPLLFLHGDRDRIVDLSLGRELFEAAPGPKHFEVIEGAGHNDTVEVGGGAYLARIGAFLDRVAPR